MFSGWFGKSGSSGGPGFEVGEPVESGLTLGGGSFALHSGQCNKKPVSVFVSNGSDLVASSAAVKRLKTLRHPSVVVYIDSIKVPDKSVSLATELVTPLLLHLRTLNECDNYLAWGILQVFRAVGFMHEAGLIHGSLHAGSVFVTSGLEWKLFGFEATASKDQMGQSYSPSLAKYQPPSGGGSRNDPSLDIWGLGCLVWEVFNGPLDSMSQLAKVGKISKQLVPTYMELVAKNPAKRPHPGAKIQQLSKPGGYFKNELIDTMVFLEEFQVWIIWIYLLLYKKNIWFDFDYVLKNQGCKIQTIWHK